MTFNLKGFMLGNAFTEYRECYEAGIADELSIYSYEHLYNHGFYTKQDYGNFKAVCIMGYQSEACKDMKKYMDKKFAGFMINPLNIYQKCFDVKLGGHMKDE